MKNITRLVFSVLLFVAAHAALGCEYPERVTVPNGTTATKEEMLEGQRGVKNFVATMETYLACIVEEEKVARGKIENLSAEEEQQREDMLSKKYNAAVDEMERIAAQYNVEVQAFRAKDSS